MKIIDFHTHPIYHTDGQKKLGGEFVGDCFVDSLKRAGIDMACGSAIDLPLMTGSENYAETMKLLNERIFAFAKKYPDFIIPGIHVQHNAVGESISEIENYSRLGLKLVGELVPNFLGGRKLSEPKAYGAASFLETGFMEIFKVCEERDLTLSIHTSTPEECAEIASRFKHLNIVMAHAGPVDTFVERVATVAAYDNLYFDISGSGTLFSGVLEYAYRNLGREKILFGTDFPGYEPGAFVGIVESANIPEESKEYIFHKNAERLLGL